MINESPTLSQRVAVGGLPVSEALQYAMELGAALRRIHSEGRVHGALTPEAVILSPSGLELLAVPPGAGQGKTAYTAPEQFQGQAPDVCTDIFSFGAVLYEMLTGRPPFHGDTTEALAASVTGSVPAPIGQPGLDRLISICLAKDRSVRWQRMQQVIMELKLLSTTARRAETGAVALQKRIESSWRNAMDQLELRLAARLEEHERAVGNLLRAADEELASRQEASLRSTSEALDEVHAQFGEVDKQLALSRENNGHTAKAAEEALLTIADLRTHVTAEVQGLKDKLQAHSVAIESTRSCVGRTDNLVERVVEALEALQSMVIEHA